VTTTYDDIIVGAGSSGAVLAAPLSEDPARRVLLLEAGPDYPAVETTPHDLRDSTWISVVQHDWGFKADALKGRGIEFPRGKVTGGSSAVNATIALRGVPADYDEWASLGNADWAWSEVLPYFRRLEDDQDETHPVGTARMGPDGDAGAVVDQRGRVRGVDGLAVVDASIMPNVPRAYTNLTCIIIGERASDWMRAEE
jgi:choline dehydrogenase-like flavoprotein